MKLLPILWGYPPGPDDWKRLSAARLALGVKEKIEPARALPGSPGRILAIGKAPGWLCEHAIVNGTTDHDKLTAALGWCFGIMEHDETPDVTDQLSSWLGMELVCAGEERLDEPLG